MAVVKIENCSDDNLISIIYAFHGIMPVLAKTKKITTRDGGYFMTKMLKIIFSGNKQ